MPFPETSRGTWIRGSPFIPTSTSALPGARSFIKGYADGRFGPTDTITRARAITMVVRAAERGGIGLMSGTFGRLRVHLGNFDQNAANARKAEYNGIFHYDLSQLDPYEPMKPGAEVAQVLYDYLRLIRINLLTLGLLRCFPLRR